MEQKRYKMEGLGDIAGLSTLLQEAQVHEARANKASASQQTQKPMALGNTVVKVGGGAAAQSSVVPAGATAATAAAAPAAKSIWAIDDIPTEDALACDVQDTRPCPRYEISYKQSVGTEDTFLGMAGKTPGSADCTHLVVKVHFPGSTMKDLDLDVTKNRIKAESRTLRLFTYLPMPVDKDKGSAKFDKDTHVLTVTLPIIEEE